MSDQASDVELAEPDDEVARPDEQASDEEGSAWPIRAQAALPWLALAVATVIAFFLLWNAAEEHYQSCVQTVVARHEGEKGAAARFYRNGDLEGCSRSPF
jgi:hypothetical protein